MNCKSYKEYLLKRSYVNDPFKSYKFVTHCKIIEQILGLNHSDNCQENIYKLYCEKPEELKEIINSITLE
jgi:hypothetical protein